jgi:hypothetical protein
VDLTKILNPPHMPHGVDLSSPFIFFCLEINFIAAIFFPMAPVNVKKRKKIY